MRRLAQRIYKEADCGRAQRPRTNKSDGRNRAKKVGAPTDAALYQDSAFKKHQAQVEKALARFDSVAEWADFISFLGRLLKALQAAPKYNVIPNKLIVAKRLSQCLNPALPSGVHARALEVYTHIFSVIGADGLRRDLPVWTPGLLPFFPHAATSIKPLVLRLYETYYLPLSVDLRPVTRALLLSLLPGLEEESSEFFDRVVTLLDQLSHSVQRPFFLQTIWHVMIMTPSVRLCAFHYLARRMPRLSEPQSPPLESLHVSLLSCAIAQTLRDDTLLVRRQALDFLVQHMSLTSAMYASLTPPQRASLMDAALGTVLRRDISLNRRLYVWLLGASDTHEAQQAYFCEHALDSVKQALRDAMSRDSDAPRPFKVLVSLMDKQPLAQPLLRAIVLDVFAALQQLDAAATDDVYPTAQTLFEALDAHVLYQQLYEGVIDQVHGRTDQDRVGLFRYILSTFEPHDEDAKTVYLPILCMAFTAQLQEQMTAGKLDGPLALAVLELVQDLVQRLDARALRLHAPESPLASLQDPAREWFEDASPERPRTMQDAACLTKLIEALLQVSLQLASSASWSEVYRNSLTRRACAVVNRLVTLLDAAQVDTDTREVLSLASWSAPLFDAIAEATTFEEVHDVLRMALQMNVSSSMDFSVDFSRHAFLDGVMRQLLTYLQPDAFQHHKRAVALFFDVCPLVSDNYATTLLCQQLSQPGPERERVMNALGTLWRLDERTCIEMEACLFLLLDRLRSHDPAEKHECELWLCAYVSSYDALLIMLVDHLVRVEAERQWQPVTVGERSIPAYVYVAPFDEAYTDYYLATISALVSVAGSRVWRALQEATYTWPESVERYGADQTLPLADALKYYLLVLLRSLPAQETTVSSTTTSLCLEILRLMLAMEPPATWCADVEAALVDVLQLAMHRSDASAQIMLLRTLREVLLVQYGDEPLSDRAHALMDLLQQGLLSTTSDTLFFAWTDLAHTLLPLARHAVQECMLPLCACVQSMLIEAMPQREAPHKVAMRPASGTHASRVPRTALEINQMISLLEHTLIQALSSRNLEAERSARPVESVGSFLGNISSVFLSDSGPGPAAQPILSPMLRPASEVVQAFMYVWVAARGDATWDSVMARSLAALSRLYALYAEATLETLVEHGWNSSRRAPSSAVERVHSETIALLEALAGHAQIIFTSLCDSIAARMPMADRGRRPLRQGLVSESIMFRFLEMYAAHLDAEALAQVWPVVALLAKNVCTSGHKAFVFDTLRLVTVLGARLAQTRSFEDARLRRDIQDAFVRLYELVITLYARTLDVSSANKDSDTVSALSEREEGDVPVAPAPAPATVVQYLSAQVVPALAPLMVDADKGIALCTSLVYYVVTPGFKVRTRGGELEPLVLETLLQISRVPHSSKTWRTPVLETFMDPKFFSQSPQMGQQWVPLVTALLGAERERLADVMARIVPAPSANLFTSRESDLQARVFAIRRLSYCVYAEKRHVFLAQLPQMQEKVVEILRSGPADLVHAELYLFMRVLLCRFDSQHLTGFWPIILTEVLRILSEAKRQLPGDDSDKLHLLFSVAKLADFLITLQTEDFQIHQWLLITDTPDAICASPTWTPDSLLDALGDLIAQDHPVADAEGHAVLAMAQQGRPMLQMSRVRSLSALVPFFLHASRAFYESESRHDRDWDNVNDCLLRELFEPVRVR